MADDVLDGDDLSYDELVYTDAPSPTGSVLTGLVVLMITVLEPRRCGMPCATTTSGPRWCSTPCSASRSATWRCAVAPGDPVALLDYGSGNLRSAERALERAGAQVELTSDYDTAAEADGLVVPGVGAFAACMRGIDAVRGGTLVVGPAAQGTVRCSASASACRCCSRPASSTARRPGARRAGRAVTRLQADVVPHMGWNTVDVPHGSTLFDGVQAERFYFVHSYAAHEAPDALTTTSEHGERFVAAVERGPLSATQFHPEKSGDAGAALLRNWIATL